MPRRAFLLHNWNSQYMVTGSTTEHYFNIQRQVQQGMPFEFLSQSSICLSDCSSSSGEADILKGREYEPRVYVYYH